MKNQRSDSSKVLHLSSESSSLVYFYVVSLPASLWTIPWSGKTLSHRAEEVVTTLPTVYSSSCSFFAAFIKSSGHRPVSQESRTAGNRVPGRGFFWRIRTTR